jgi:hypothetical protein
MIVLQIIKKGSIVVITSGDYECFQMDGMYRALQDIDLSVLLQEFQEKHPEFSGTRKERLPDIGILEHIVNAPYVDNTGFIHFLTNEVNMLENVNYSDIHLGVDFTFIKAISVNIPEN